MSHYIDGFVMPVPTEHLATYKRLAKLACKVWIEHGALDYRECVIEDPEAKGTTPFPKLAKAKPGETVVLAWITYKSRAQRDRVNAKVMKDPRMTCYEACHLFDFKRMAYGGFTTLVAA